VLGDCPKPVHEITISKFANVEMRDPEETMRSRERRVVFAVSRLVYFEGVRTATVVWVFGRAERWGMKAVPSSPAPRRRILVWNWTDMIGSGSSLYRFLSKSHVAGALYLAEVVNYGGT
jgi:hypothetical protein